MVLMIWIYLPGEACGDLNVSSLSVKGKLLLCLLTAENAEEKLLEWCCIACDASIFSYRMLFRCCKDCWFCYYCDCRLWLSM